MRLPDCGDVTAPLSFFFDHCLDEVADLCLQFHIELIDPIVAGSGNRIDVTWSRVMNSPKRHATGEVSVRTISILSSTRGAAVASFGVLGGHEIR
jgi:hypothetical protein